MANMMNGVKMKKTDKIFQVEKIPKAYPVRVPKVEAQKQLKSESTSESRRSPYQKRRPGRIQSLFWMLFVWMER